LINRIGDRYFQYSFATTAGIVLLLSAIFVQRVSHRRALDIAVKSVADICRHDQYARQVAREAIRRYNDHIESCNRMIEASESGLWKWTSSADLDGLKGKIHHANDELAAARKEIERLNHELADKSSLCAEMSMRSKGPAPPKAQDLAAY